ncbi:MAG: ThiF family adenylyltransferase [Acidobacteria bacterium]|nr:ThiF family adenylyltransferase [Acidobacteriota bacterium]
MTPRTPFSPGEQDRYSRQILFPGIGLEGQAKLNQARVAIVGCGALGSFHAGALARAGVGQLTLIDRDYVELSNLQRQWLYEEADAEQGLPKAVAAAQRLARINSGVKTIPQVADLTPESAEDLLADADLILDGTDNFESRYLINDYALSAGVPWVYGAAVASYGLVMPIVPGKTACFRCVYPEPPSGAQPTCETAGVVNTITSVIASLQVSLALRLLVGEEVPGTLMTLDIWTGLTRSIAAPAPDPECPCCGRRNFEYLDGCHRAPISLCGRNAVQIHERTRPLDLVMLEAQLAPLGPVRANGFALRFLHQQYELTFFPDGRAIIKGTTDPGIARSLYARFVGA